MKWAYWSVSGLLVFAVSCYGFALLTTKQEEKVHELKGSLLVKVYNLSGGIKKQVKVENADESLLKKQMIEWINKNSDRFQPSYTSYKPKLILECDTVQLQFSKKLVVFSKRQSKGKVWTQYIVKHDTLSKKIETMIWRIAERVEEGNKSAEVEQNQSQK